MQSLNYNVYRLSLREWIELIFKVSCVLIVIGYLFFDTFLVCFLLPLAVFGVVGLEKKIKIQRRRKNLGNQFKDAIILLYSFVAAGSTLEDSFVKTALNLPLTYDKESDIVREFNEITRKLSMNINIEACLEDLARRSEQEDIQDFVQVISIAKRSGGSMTSIIKNSVDAIKTKIEAENEIHTMMAGKKNEFRIMTVIPAAILLYMRVFSAGFLDVLYENTAGNAIMVICLCVYGAAVFWGTKVLNVQV